MGLITEKGIPIAVPANGALSQTDSGSASFRSQGLRDNAPQLSASNYLFCCQSLPPSFILILSSSSLFVSLHHVPLHFIT